jgi:hypothetical protein
MCLGPLSRELTGVSSACGRRLHKAKRRVVAHTHSYLWTKWKRPALRFSHPWADGGPRSSSVPYQWSERPRGATQCGSGRSAKSLACSASEQYAEVTSSVTPSRLAAAYRRSKAAPRPGAWACPRLICLGRFRSGADRPREGAHQPSSMHGPRQRDSPLRDWSTGVASREAGLR